MGVEGQVGRRRFAGQRQLGQFGPGIGGVCGSGGAAQADAQAVEQRIGGAGRAFGDQDQVAAGRYPVEQAALLRGVELLARAEQQQAAALRRAGGERRAQAVGALDGDLLAAQEMFGGQPGIAAHLRRRAELDALAGDFERQQQGEQRRAQAQRGEQQPERLGERSWRRPEQPARLTAQRLARVGRHGRAPQASACQASSSVVAKATSAGSSSCSSCART